MSFHTDWFLANEEEAENLALSGSPFEEWPSLSLQSIGEIDLMKLYTLLGCKDADEIKSVSEELLFQGSEEGPFVVQVAPPFVDALCEIQEARLSEIAVAWGQKEGLTGTKQANIVETIVDLSKFARRSRRENKTILGLFAL